MFWWRPLVLKMTFETYFRDTFRNQYKVYPRLLPRFQRHHNRFCNFEIYLSKDNYASKVCLAIFLKLILNAKTKGFVEIQSKKESLILWSCWAKWFCLKKKEKEWTHVRILKLYCNVYYMFLTNFWRNFSVFSGRK